MFNCYFNFCLDVQCARVSFLTAAEATGQKTVVLSQQNKFEFVGLNVFRTKGL
jgi:hypothetical protein